MSDIQHIPLNKLVESEDNVRRIERKRDIDALAASIAAHGLLQNLTVTERDAGKYAVVAGARRHAALKLLVRQGERAKDWRVPCWRASAAHGYASPYWQTFNQAIKLGAHVRKGERGEIVVYYGSAQRTAPAADGGDTETAFRFLKSYVAFNADQVEGLPERFYPKPTDAEAYAATLNHEAVHAPPHPIAWRDLSKRFKEAVAAEELVAEIGAAILGAHLRLPPDHIFDHAAYIENWMSLLQSGKRAFFHAAAQAQAAVDWLLAKSPAPDETHVQA